MVMKTILEYLSTKNMKSKDELDYATFCEILLLDKSKQEAKKLFQYFKNDCDKVIGDSLEDEQRYSTDFELIFMVAAMLNDDQNLPKVILTMGFTGYAGNNNPYDFSWFDDTNENDMTVLEVMQELYQKGGDFKDMFDDVYWCLDACCQNYKKAIEGIWSLQDNLEY